MSEPYIGEIRMVGFSFPPVGWSMCDGQLIPISQNDALFTLIGTTYGGDGQETFALPNLQSRVPVHMGTLSGTTTVFPISEMAGTEEVTLTTQQIPVHTHALLGSEGAADQLPITNNVPGEATKRFYVSPTTVTAMGANSIGPTGGSQPHENMQPFLVITFIISLFGLFPQQN